MRRILALTAAAAIAAAGLASSPVRAEPEGAFIPTIRPVELRVPAAGIDAAVQTVGVAGDGSMGVPSNFSDVAWFSAGYRPGEFGHAVFDGHVSNVDSAAVFFHVEDLVLGAKIYVIGEDGTLLMFQVTDIESYPLDVAPLAQIFGSSDWPQVVLITCGGGWHEDIHLFDHRTVVYSSLISVLSP